MQKRIIKLPLQEKSLHTLKSVAIERPAEYPWCYVHRELLLALILEIEAHRKSPTLPRVLAIASLPEKITSDMFDS